MKWPTKDSGSWGTHVKLGRGWRAGAWLSLLHWAIAVAISLYSDDAGIALYLGPLCLFVARN